MERACSESIGLDGFRERCAAIAERAEFIQHSSAIDIYADRFASAACATSYGSAPGTEHEQRR
jgi:hypothetical protein